jgi:hypothetical protein
MGINPFNVVKGKGEDILSNIPVLGPLLGARSEEERALLEQQKRMAEDAKRRQALVGPARMQAMNQQMAAFGPRNRMMAQMFGPEAAFTGEQISDMTANPMPNQGDPKAKALDAELKKYGLNSYEDVLAYNKQAGHQITDSKGFSAAMKYRQEQEAAAAAEKKRRAMHEANFATGPGPAPINPIQAAPVRRF